MVDRAQSFAIQGDEVYANVHDTTGLRAAFLHYCKIGVKPGAMHLASKGVFMSAAQFADMARDIGLLEPQGGLVSG